MVQIEWTNEALDDVENIRVYISQDSDSQAGKVLVRLFQAVDRLEHFPEIGASVPEVNTKRFREIHVFKYRIIYRYDKKTNEINILAVVHAARQLSRKFLRELK